MKNPTLEFRLLPFLMLPFAAACGGLGGSDTDGGQEAGFDAGVATCSTGVFQPSTCTYGQFCTIASECFSVSAPTCNNFPAGSAPLTWNPATASGPVIIDISKKSLGTDSTFCGTTAPVRGKVHVMAYDTSGRLDGQTAQPSLTYYRTTQTTLAVDSTQIQNYDTFSSSGNYAEFDVNFCAPTGTTSLTIGLAYDNGNGFCFTLN